MPNNNKTIADFLAGRSQHTIELFDHFIAMYNNIGIIELHTVKTMIGISNTIRKPSPCRCCHRQDYATNRLSSGFYYAVFNPSSP